MRLMKREKVVLSLHSQSLDEDGGLPAGRGLRGTTSGHDRQSDRSDERVRPAARGH